MDNYSDLAKEISLERFNYTLPEKLAETIQMLITGEDVFAVFPTGGGKSNLYVLPPLIQDKVTYN